MTTSAEIESPVKKSIELHQGRQQAYVAKVALLSADAAVLQERLVEGISATGVPVTAIASALFGSFSPMYDRVLMALAFGAGDRSGTPSRAWRNPRQNDETLPSGETSMPDNSA